jgi:hypothetical protein
MTLGEKIIQYAIDNPGKTARQITDDVVVGSDNPQQRANGPLLEAVRAGRLVRTGVGGRTDPFKYFPV